MPCPMQTLDCFTVSTTARLTQSQTVIKDVLLRMNAKLADCHGQCYDGALNMSGARKGVAAIITQEESRALYTHCY